jgi:hypothetical protein
LDHYRCCYRLGLRRAPGDDWTVLSIHFQVAERLESSHDDTELDRLLDQFLDRYFAAGRAEH